MSKRRLLFSERMGFKSVRQKIQIDSIDVDLKNRLWDILTTACLIDPTPGFDRISSVPQKYRQIYQAVWIRFSGQSLDQMPVFCDSTRKSIRKWFYSDPDTWYICYDIVELALSQLPEDVRSTAFDWCNSVLENGMSAYRFINGVLTPIIDEAEVSSVEQALSIPNDPFRDHLVRALELLSDRKNPDHRNSIKESISAVESFCSQQAGLSKPDLKLALKELQKEHHVHGAMKEAFIRLYGYSSDEEGVRHAITQLFGSEKVQKPDAVYMLVTCSAFVNYLHSKINGTKLNDATETPQGSE